MTTTETGATAPEADGRPEAILALADDFKAFAGDVQARLQQQDDRMTRLDRKQAMTGHRPALSVAAETGAPHGAAFVAYLRSGDEAALRALEIEGKAMNSGSGGDGGYLVSPQTAEGIGAVLRATGSLRSVARVVQVEASVFDVLIDRGEMGAGWAAESGTTTETSTGTLQKISIPVHELAAMPKVSQRLLDDAAFDIEGWIAERIGEKFARAEAAAFISGDGSNKPKGFLDHTKVANGSWAWGSLGYVAGGNASAITSADVLVDVVHALEAPYRAGAVWVMNSRTAGALRKLKDDDGRYLWAEALAAGEPARLLGHAVVVAEDMPDIGADAFPVTFGNFAAGYTIVERPDLRVLRDPFSAKPNVLFYATRRVGGGVTDFAAIKLLRIAGS
ncbi:MAG: phage major capsid protein [Rubellimicrobium sp.]|nr:phage major capsid protein [Rubellimicrobium sp.]